MKRTARGIDLAAGLICYFALLSPRGCRAVTYRVSYVDGFEDGYSSCWSHLERVIHAAMVDHPEWGSSVFVRHLP